MTMHKFVRLFSASVVVFLIAGQVASSSAQLNTVDALWAEVSRTVEAGDWEGYAATYHPDAVLVTVANQASYPIAAALQGWKQGFDDTKAGKQQSGVEFRFSQRIASETTAHDTGIFHYWAINAEGERSEYYVHFEALLVKKDGWKMIMEYQKDATTADEWQGLSE